VFPSTVWTSRNAPASFGIIRLIRCFHCGPTLSLHGFSLPTHACTHALSVCENAGSSFAPDAITTATTRYRAAILASWLVCETSVYCLTFPSPTCADGAPEHARLNALVTPGSRTWWINACGERWHQLPFSPFVPRS
jgi:hypothetical protein